MAKSRNDELDRLACVFPRTDDACETPAMVGYRLDHHQPLADRQIGVLKDAHFHRKTLSTVGALERRFIAEMKDAVAAAMRAKLALNPAYRAKMARAALLIKERLDQIEKAIKMLDQGRSLSKTKH